MQVKPPSPLGSAVFNLCSPQCRFNTGGKMLLICYLYLYFNSSLRFLIFSCPINVSRFTCLIDSMV